MVKAACLLETYGLEKSQKRDKVSSILLPYAKHVYDTERGLRYTHYAGINTAFSQEGENGHLVKPEAIFCLTKPLQSPSICQGISGEWAKNCITHFSFIQ